MFTDLDYNSDVLLSKPFGFIFLKREYKFSSMLPSNVYPKSVIKTLQFFLLRIFEGFTVKIRGEDTETIVETQNNSEKNFYFAC